MNMEAIRRTNHQVQTAAMLVACMNLVLLWVAIDDKSWGAIGIAMLFGPLLNLSVAAALVAWASHGKISIGARPSWQTILPFWLMPLLATVLDWVVIAQLPLHGC